MTHEQRQETDDDLSAGDRRAKHALGRRLIRLAVVELRGLGKSIIRWIAISSLLLLAALMFMPRPRPIAQNSTLFVAIDRQLSEASPLDSLPILQFILNPPKLSASMIERELRIAADDSKIAAIAVSLDGLSGTGAGPANRIGDALDAARAKGKTVTVYSTNYDNASWLIASRADDILMSPMGRFDVGGVKTGALFFGDALKKYGVDVVVGQAGKFKSAVEPFTRGEMSPAARAALTEAMSRQQSALSERLAARAKKPASEIIETMSRWSPDKSPADEALALGLVDRLAEAPEFMDAAFGPPQAAQARSYIALSHYAMRNHRDACRDDWRILGRDGPPAANAIGVITIEGPITTGYTTAEHAGSESIVAQVEGFSRDAANRALLLRIDSPGGDASAAEHIRATLVRYKSLGRPLFVSMSSTAASGGYWIATAGDRLFAEPTTITGSIGVFSLRTSAAGVLERYGVRWDGLSVGRTNPYGGVAEPSSMDEISAMQSDVDRVYRRFVALVAEARGLDPATFEQWAEGRIWHAYDAKSIGLVDAIGGVGDALEALSDAADVPATCARPAKPVSSTESLISSFSPMSIFAALMGSADYVAAARRAAQMPPPFRELLSVSELGGLQARCLLCSMGG